MELKTYIEQVGDAAAAQLFGVKKRTAASWRRGERLPRPEQAERIVEVTGGKVSWRGIYAREKTAA